MADEDAPIDPDKLGIAAEKVCYIIISSRELDADSLEGDEADEAASPARDLEAEADDPVEEFAHDATYQELHSFIDGLNEEEQIGLVALMWVGRGEYSVEEWQDAVDEAERAHNEHTADYLIDTPLLADYLEEGLDQFGISCDDIDPGRL